MKKKTNKSKFIIVSVLITFCLIGICTIWTMSRNKSIHNSNNNSDIYINTNNSDNGKSSSTDRFDNIALTNKNIGIPVLYYHSVDENAINEVTITPENLREQLNYINDNGYTTITIKELSDYITNNQPIPENSILITFDDGYMNNYTEAFPILKDLNMKATIFCVGNSLDGSYYLSEEAIKEMSDNGIDIESHTINHVHLDTLTYDEQLLEMKQSKEILEKITGKKVTAIAYPFGDYNDDSIKAAKSAGYDLCFTTHLGLADRDDDKYELDRIYISSNYDMDTFKDLLKNTKK